MYFMVINHQLVHHVYFHLRETHAGGMCGHIKILALSSSVSQILKTCLNVWIVLLP